MREKKERREKGREREEREKKEKGEVYSKLEELLRALTIQIFSYWSIQHDSG